MMMSPMASQLSAQPILQPPPQLLSGKRVIKVYIKVTIILLYVYELSKKVFVGVGDENLGGESGGGTLPRFRPVYHPVIVGWRPVMAGEADQNQQQPPELSRPRSQQQAYLFFL